MVRPNGLAFSPDERILYVADTGATHKENGPRHIRRFAVVGRRPERQPAARCSPMRAISKVTDEKWERETRWIDYDRENYQVSARRARHRRWNWWMKGGTGWPRSTGCRYSR